MSEKVLIASDSTTDLSPEQVAQYDIKIIPLCVTVGGKTYTDGVDINPDKIYEHYHQTGELPKTSAINIAQFEDFFEQYTKEGYSIVIFTISSSMSSTFSNARLAAEDYPNVHVVDTKNLSTGGGLLLIRASEMAAAGYGAEDIARVCEELAPCIDASFVIDNLEFLYKGGRCTALEAFGANLLSLKPCISVKNGKMGVGKKYRGKFDRVLPIYIQDRVGDGSGIYPEHVFITHAGCDPEVVEACVEQVKSMGYFENIMVSRAGCTVSSHCGRNTLGVLFIRKEPIE